MAINCPFTIPSQALADTIQAQVVGAIPLDDGGVICHHFLTEQINLAVVDLAECIIAIAGNGKEVIIV